MNANKLQQASAALQLLNALSERRSSAASDQREEALFPLQQQLLEQRLSQPQADRELQQNELILRSLGQLSENNLTGQVDPTMVLDFLQKNFGYVQPPQVEAPVNPLDKYFQQPQQR